MISCPEIFQFYTLDLFPIRLENATGRKVHMGDYPWTSLGTTMRTLANQRTPTNAEFAKNDGNFHKACEMARVEPTARQASKFRSKKGAAYRALKGISF